MSSSYHSLKSNNIRGGGGGGEGGAVKIFLPLKILGQNVKIVKIFKNVKEKAEMSTQPGNM